MQNRSLITLVCAAGLLAACGSEEPEPVQPPAPALTSAPTPNVTGDGSPLTAGEWLISEDGNGASASFGQNSENVRLVIACDRASNMLTMAMADDRNTAGMQSFVLEAGGTAARLDMMPNNDPGAPMLTAEIARNAPVFGGFAQDGGAIAITYPTGNVLRLPASTGIARVFEACA